MFFPTWIDGNAYGNVETNGEIIGGETIAGTKRKRERERRIQRGRDVISATYEFVAERGRWRGGGEKKCPNGYALM